MTSTPSLFSPGRLHPRDLTASVVVFLVALPLCVGVAVASGVPAELGLVTGIVGGLVAGLLPGSSLQVSGPAAGLTVLVAETVGRYGVPGLAVIVLAAGLLQILLGASGLGRWFTAISMGVVEGMLAGIGLLIIIGQLYALADLSAPTGGLPKLAGLLDLPDRIAASASAAPALLIGVGTIAVLAGWQWLPARVRAVPAPLIAVVAAGAVVAAFGLPVARIQIDGLSAALALPTAQSLSLLTDPAVWATVLAFALIASAESLFSAAAVDRMHHGPRTNYNKELVAQGAGNAVCGLLGALPMTAVIVRSASNVQAGAQTKASRVLHGVWLLLFAVLLPAALNLIPVATLAGILVYTGFKLLPLRGLAPLWSRHRGELVVLVITAVAVVSLNLFEGVLIGLAAAVAKAAWEASHVRTTVEDKDGGKLRVTISGNATFLRVPTLLGTLEAIPREKPVELDLRSVQHLDHACRTAVDNWASRQESIDVQPVGALSRH